MWPQARHHLLSRAGHACQAWFEKSFPFQMNIMMLVVLLQTGSATSFTSHKRFWLALLPRHIYSFLALSDGLLPYGRCYYGPARLSHLWYLRSVRVQR